MNSYGSITRRLISRNLVVQPISPPNAFTIPQLTVQEYIFEYDTSVMNPHGNIRIVNVGLFSNFMDGLVANGHVKISLAFRLTYLYNPTLLTGTIQANPDNSNLTGVGTLFLAELNLGDWIVPEILGLTVGCPVRIGGIGGDLAATIDNPSSNYDLTAGAGYAYNRLTTGLDVVLGGFFINSDALNEMHPCDLFYEVAPYVPVTTGRIYPVLSARLTFFNTTQWLTKTIDPSYAGDNCRFSVQADVEFTQRP